MKAVTLLTDLPALENIVDDWHGLVAETVGATVYQTPEWALAWQRAYAETAVPFGIALWEHGRLIGLAPLWVESVWGVRVVRFMGGELNDLNCFLAAPATLPRFRAVVARTLQEHPHQWDVLSWRGLEDHDGWVKTLPDQLSMRPGLRRLEASEIPSIALPPVWETYQARLSPHRRKRFRLAERSLRAQGTVTFRLLTEPADLKPALQTFFDARTENWRARKRLHRMVGIQRTAWYWNTLYNLCLELSAKGSVWLGRLDVNDVPVGWDLAFTINGVVIDYMTTFDLRYEHCSPGHLVLLEMIRHALGQGSGCFVLGRGAQPYKFWLGAAPRHTENLLMYANRPRARAYVEMRILRERAYAVARRLESRH